MRYVKTLAYAVLAFGMTAGLAQAQSMNKDSNPKQSSPGATGALDNVHSQGIATDPGGVAAQEGTMSKASPGTVGAAPGASTNSENPRK